MAERTSRAPAPLAACGAILVALAAAGLARGYDAAHDAPAPEAPRASARPDAGAPTEVGHLLQDRPLDVNRATAEELQLLPRIGPTLAARIIEERERHGPFRSVRDLERVRGIGPRTIEALGRLAAAGPPSGAPDGGR